MAAGATIYTFDVELADVDRGVYESLTLRVAQHPSETAAYMLTRILAYCLEFAEGIKTVDEWLVPIVADAEAGFGGPLNAFELMKSMIASGAAGVHWEDQLASEKKCGHLGGKVLIPTQQHVRTLNAARLALSGDGRHAVSLDRVIRTMRETGRDMSTKYKETARGGLALNVIEC